MDPTPGRQFYERQISFLEKGDIAALMGQYHDDAVLIGFDLHVEGKDALREHMRGYLATLGTLRLLSTDRFTESDDAIFFEATVETDHGTARVYDVFMLRDGRATHQFTGVISFTPSPA